MDKEGIDRFNKDYYKDKFLHFGDTPRGVDWKDKQSQSLGFQHIMDAIRFYFPSLKSFSIFEVGCGYGAFFEFLREKNLHNDISYSGIDLVDEMITAAITKFPELENNLYTGDFKSFRPQSTFDFVTSNGIFNVKKDIDEHIFEKNILHMIELMFNLSEKGTVFNLMTPSPDYKDPRLFYPSLDVIFGFIYKKLSRKIVVLSSYPLWKITIGVFR